MNDQYQPEHVNTLENEHFYEKPLETPVAAEDADIPVEKTEAWKPAIPGYVPAPSYVPAATPTPVPLPVPAPASQVVGNAGNPEMLLASEELQHFRARWNGVQAKFVDEPRSSVQEADALVTELMAQFSQMIAKERQTLEAQWSAGEVSTEDLRQILQRYRVFFNRLLK